ncbi:potassium transporter [Bradyrhizobium jicamae]|uniref:Potassium transporter n=1 Tax=Bradyrhizobium jicamae TaxID=280332 RepID=A0ABS5FYY3_9BRAD|nr:ion channel [Bradyrhizobium jicamae]MBR0801466.1 potassium transporter [Bradyrhizobium jicamae]MBR0939120.1 potassium transporter [Bradyrhizobium jicamae]
MAGRAGDRAPKARRIRLGNREVVTEGLELSFWADISHRCMTASWPAFIGGAALVFIVFNGFFALLYWFGDQPISNVPRGAYIDYLYFSIETLSTAGYGDMHPQSHYGHFIAAVELFTGIFSMSLMTGLIFARFSRPSARLLFADNPVISTHEGRQTLMIRLANERHNIIANATAQLWVFKSGVSKEGVPYRRFYDLPLIRSQSPALALSWTVFHVIDEASPLHGLDAAGLKAANVGLGLMVSGYDDVAAQTVHARKSYEHDQIRFGHRYVEILRVTEDGLRIDYSRFHETVEG